MKKIILSICGLLLLLSGCGPTTANVPESIVIEGVTYRTGFYGELYPQFGSKDSAGTQAYQGERNLHADDDDAGRNTFRRVEVDGHSWMHLDKGISTGGTVYCPDTQWEELCAYYADPANFTYYFGAGTHIIEGRAAIAEIDLNMFDALFAFGEENGKNPFDSRHNNRVLEYAQRLPMEYFKTGLFFYKVSNDGFFAQRSQRYYVYDGKLFLLFYHDYGSRNGGVKETVVVEVPQELGQYFMDLAEEYQPYLMPPEQ